MKGAMLFDADPSMVATTTDDWYTPRVFAAADITFDMDVAAPVDPAMRTCPAREYLTPTEDGLTTPWHGVVWCNPPYSKAEPWVDKWAAHPEGMILLPALPEVHWRGVLMGNADAFAILAVNFNRADGRRVRVPWANVIAARGAACTDALVRVSNADRYANGAYLVRPA